MKIYYQPQKKIFFHSDPSLQSLMFGRNSYILYREDEPYKHGFNVSAVNNACGPVIGILTANEKGSYLGNFPLFQELQKVITTRGGISFVFSLSDIGGERIEGLCFNEEKNTWISCKFPIPHFIYNRVPSPSMEKTEEFTGFLQWVEEKQIHFFNPHFFNKWEIYQCLSENESLKPHLPETKLLQSKEALENDLRTKQKIYIKPVLSSKGKGIRLLEQSEDGQIVCKSTKKIERFLRYDRLMLRYPEWYETDQYIYQEAIPCQKLNNHRYDLRVLVHFTGTSFLVTGIGIRVSERQEVTTHVPQGGKILPFHFVETEELLEKIEALAEECGKQLTASFGLIGEFSMDLGLRESDGLLVVFEINSKPMKFDEEEIEEKRLGCLADSFFHFSKASRQLST
ncbi:YheC/YheD family protein [Bacillus salacetis]|uniref:YheC/YheD family protein n=1 Tax=Bacillus salacetis TaxID=2315464 RepID=A0A3A1QWZ0_9BACI|nr:YheC/YheD family protein [Bacillus salacetis]RIW30916.1 YheC/YheD family protein [Bacillus salacetis]